METANKITRTVLGSGLALAAILIATFNAAAGDGIAASPKVRQMLNERAAKASVAPVIPSVTVTYSKPRDGVAASPRVRQMLNEQSVVISQMPSTEVAAVGYPRGADGIAASPRLRQQLNERSSPIIIAPLK
jgi:pyruvate/2-oxoglutarate dehydrogenase complex dihydrolipoamide acyltransferase (E2) component